MNLLDLARSAVPNASEAAGTAARPTLRAAIREHKPAIMAELAANDANGEPAAHGDPAAEADSPTGPMLDAAVERRRARVLAILAANPDFKYAVVTDSNAEPGAVVVHIGIRGIASGEIVIAKAKYDGAELLRAVERAGSGGGALLLADE